MRRSKVLVCTAAAALALVAIVAGGAPGPVRVLFIGNSYTYFNNLPAMFAGLAAAAKQPADTRMVAPGGWRLKDHWQKGEARSALAEDRWDYVVLQDQSTLGVTLYVEGKARVSSDEIFRPFADSWAAAIRKAGARPVFYLTWARRASPEDQDTLTHAYMSAARASGALVAPVGLAWRRVRESYPKMPLFADDGSHPSPAGSYLAACTFFAALFDRDPAGLPATVQGPPVDLETEKPRPGQIATLARLSPDDARILQQAAWSAWREVKAAGGYADAKPASQSLAALPAPAPIPAGTLAGTWDGTLLMHPAGPAPITLRIERSAAGAWSGHLRATFEKTESAELQELVVGDGELRFAVPKSDALGGLRVGFHGVSVSPSELRGTAEAAGTDPDAPLRLLGSWRATRRSSR